MKSIFFLGILILLSSCIGDDFIDDQIDPVLKIKNPVDTLAIDSSYQFEYSYLNNIGLPEMVEVEWTSSANDIIEISSQGLARAVNSGKATISVEHQGGSSILMDEKEIVVGDRTVGSNTERTGTVNTTSSYKLTGEFVLSQGEGDEIILEFGEDYEASTALPGLYVYLSNNPNTISNAFEIQAVEVFKGAHNYTIKGVELNQYKYVLYFCKPFNVKVGHGEME